MRINVFNNLPLSFLFNYDLNNLKFSAPSFHRFSTSRLNIRQPGTPRHRSAAMSHFRPVATTNTLKSYNLTKPSSNIVATNSPNVLTVAARFSNFDQQQAYPKETKKECIIYEKSQLSSQKYKSPVTSIYESAAVFEQPKNSTYKQPKQVSQQQSTVSQTTSEEKPAEFLEVTLKSTKFSALFYGPKKDPKKDLTPFGNYKRSPYGNPSLCKSNNNLNPYVRSISYHGPLSDASYSNSSQSSGSYFRPIGCSFFQPSFMSSSKGEHSENIHQMSASAPSLVQSRIKWALNMSSYDGIVLVMCSFPFMHIVSLCYTAHFYPPFLGIQSQRSCGKASNRGTKREKQKQKQYKEII